MTLIRFLPFAALLAFTALLAGCGFQPMYATGSDVAAIRSVDVDIPGRDRPAQLLAESLRDRFGAPSGTQRYRLVAEPDIAAAGLGVGADDIATRFALVMTVTFTLQDLSTGEIVVQDYVRSEAAYDVPTQPYAAESARRDAEERAARDAAERISAHVARYLRRANPS
ncbi:LPS assembly lipoprotein LptE [Hyphobacterium marinum]|uniref:LPS assembly lipoprotein LptE n=1 Tax=Hyphobacterium marinum TaxID=3116574 RepID=A0ABU7LVZ4_9PROT|nr:LPS assembly lipoprotein LptE [Hyphobacterium sp. Y6023]MEE2565360.1 LPS assembly lipoprotein LptE [Hyphobacterium sp. Y6023]